MRTCFFFRVRKFYAWMTLRLISKIKKGFENTLFEIRAVVKYPPSRTNIYIYIYIYIYKVVIVVIQRGITIHTVSF
jgi:hypothetical protein